MPTSNSRLLLLLVLVMRIVLAIQFVADLEAEVWSDFEHFGQDFEVEVQARF